MDLPSQLHPGWGMASPAGQTDPAGRAHGNWAIRTQPRVLLYLTCNLSPSTTGTLLPLSTYCSKHPTARALLSSSEGQNQAGHILITFNFLNFPGKSFPLCQHRKERTNVSHLNVLLKGIWIEASVGFPTSIAYHRAWYPLTYLWMVMAAFLIRTYFFRISQPRIVFWMRIQAALNLSALIFSR